MWKPKKRKEERQAYEKILLLVGEAMLAQLDMMEELFEEARAGLNLAGVENKHVRNPIPHTQAGIPGNDADRQNSRIRRSVKPH